jgi:hypothetical protein
MRTIGLVFYAIGMYFLVPTVFGIAYLAAHAHAHEWPEYGVAIVVGIAATGLGLLLYFLDRRATPAVPPPRIPSLREQAAARNAPPPSSPAPPKGRAVSPLCIVTLAMLAVGALPFIPALLYGLLSLLHPKAGGIAYAAVMLVGLVAGVGVIVRAVGRADARQRRQYANWSWRGLVALLIASGMTWLGIVVVPLAFGHDAALVALGTGLFIVPVALGLLLGVAFAAAFLWLTRR